MFVGVLTAMTVYVIQNADQIRAIFGGKYDLDYIIYEDGYELLTN
jgi:hypothetical protein